MNRRQTCIVALCILSMVGCSTGKKQTIQPTKRLHSTIDLIELIKERLDSINTAHSRKDKIKLAQHCIELAEECIMKSPEEAACYYWRAAATGMYYQSRIIGYQDGVKSMIKDLKRAIKLDPTIEHGGAYRLLGKLYTELPEFTLRKDGVTRDLQQAEKLLYTAIHISPKFPENRLFLAEALIAANKTDEALQELKTVQELLPEWKPHKNYKEWLHTLKKLQRKTKLTSRR